MTCLEQARGMCRALETSSRAGRQACCFSVLLPFCILDSVSLPLRLEALCSSRQCRLDQHHVNIELKQRLL